MIGQVIGGKYELLQVIGQGGMATVYKAYQPGMDRYVAIKLLSRQLSEDPTFLKRFQREVRVIAQLEHRAILPVYDHGEIEGAPYIVMRLVEGGTLRRRMFNEELTVPLIMRVTEQIAEALDHAHSKRILHRDIKPSNILLDHYDNAYLTDFGIAKMLGGETSQVTGDSGVIGTPSYMSPEQCQGKELGPASDQYALGAILFEMLAGVPPYVADTPLTVMYMHVRDPIPSVLTDAPDLPPEVDPVLKRALAKKPIERYPSNTALAQAFRRALDAAPQLLAAPPEEGKHTPTPPRPVEQPAAPGQAPTVPSGYHRPVTGLPRYEDLFTDDSAEVVGAVPPEEEWFEETAAAPRVRGGRPSMLAGAVGALVLILAAGLSLGGILLFGGGTGGGIAAGPTLPPSPTSVLYVVITNTPTATSSAPSPSPTDAPTRTPISTATLPPAPPTSLPATPSPASPPPTNTPTQAPSPTATQNPPSPTPTQPQVISGSGRIAYTQGSRENAEIAIINVDGSGARVLTDNDFYDGEPDWTADGGRLVYESQPGDDIDLYIINADGTGARRLTDLAADDRHADWSPDASVIVFESGSGQETEIYAIRPDGGGLTQLTDNNASDRAPRFSSDGTRIAFMTNRRDKWEIAVMAYPSGDLIDIYDCPAPDCRFPDWSPDGLQIVYNTLDATRQVEDEIWLLNVAGGQSSRLISGEDNGRADWSADGLIYFNRSSSGQTRIYQFNPNSSALTPLAIENGYGPDWDG